MASIVNAIHGANVALVDRNGNRTGHMEKMLAHQEGKLHEAFSVLVFNEKGEILLQQRAVGKYHSAGKWSNTCCSHPDPFDSSAMATTAAERLRFEMGFTCELEVIDAIYYREELPNGMVEHEYDHILIGHHADDPQPEKTEVQDWRWAMPALLMSDLTENPTKYSAWLHHLFQSKHLSRYM
jgi:isopentenyl-diphosphate delta-isomerase